MPIKPMPGIIKQASERYRAAKAAKAPAPETVVETIAVAPVTERPVIGALPDGTPVRLRVHSVVLEMPSYVGTEDFETLCGRVAEHGVIDPVVCHSTEEVDEVTGYPWLEIVNGRHRYEAVRRLIMETASPIVIPCVLRETAVADVVVDTLLGRRNTASPGIRAYLVWPYLAPQVAAAAAAGKASRAAKLKKNIGAATIFPPSDIPNAPLDGILGLARRYGFSYETLNRAKNIHARYDERPDLRDQFEPRILSGNLSIELALRGMGGKIETERSEEDIEQGAKKRRTPPPSELITRTIKDWGNRLTPTVWESIDKDERPALSTAIIDGVLAWPADITKQLRKALALKGGES